MQINSSCSLTRPWIEGWVSVTTVPVLVRWVSNTFTQTLTFDNETFSRNGNCFKEVDVMEVGSLSSKKQIWILRSDARTRPRPAISNKCVCRSWREKKESKDRRILTLAVFPGLNIFQQLRIRVTAESESGEEFFCAHVTRHSSSNARYWSRSLLLRVAQESSCFLLGCVCSVNSNQ